MGAKPSRPPIQVPGSGTALATRSISPAVGSVMRLRILSRVLLPAPLRPMMPTTSPFMMSKDRSRKAQNVSLDARRKGCRARWASISATVEGRFSSWTMV